MTLANTSGNNATPSRCSRKSTVIVLEHFLMETILSNLLVRHSACGGEIPQSAAQAPGKLGCLAVIASIEAAVDHFSDAQPVTGNEQHAPVVTAAVK
jgi:hypothetical protein